MALLSQGKTFADSLNEIFAEITFTNINGTSLMAIEHFGEL